ncbi:MAG TPA: hypothetical protein VML75_10475 [Kofleriaceae bacterium]|nr:hypothetical protein [Kofleriaceae bacterium]
MFFRAAVLALLGSIIVMQVGSEVRLARHDYATARAQRHAQHGDRAPLPSARGRLGPETQLVDLRRGELDQALATGALAGQARVVPVTREGAPSGFKVYAIRPGSLVQALGLRNGDTVLAISDVPVIGAHSALDVYAALRAGPAFFDLDVRRGGQHVRIVVLLHD